MTEQEASRQRSVLRAHEAVSVLYTHKTISSRRRYRREELLGSRHMLQERLYHAGDAVFRLVVAPCFSAGERTTLIPRRFDLVDRKCSPTRIPVPISCGNYSRGTCSICPSRAAMTNIRAQRVNGTIELIRSRIDLFNNHCKYTWRFGGIPWQITCVIRKRDQ